MTETLRPTIGDLETLRHAWGELRGEALIRAVRETFGDHVAVLTSAGADAAITLSAVATVDPTIPVLFGDTHKHFTHTYQHMNMMKDRFGLTNVISPALDAALLDEFDPKGELHAGDKDLCCGIRKVQPLEHYVRTQQVHVLIGGRMRWQNSDRANLEPLEWDDYKNVLMVNPFADLTRAEAEERKQSAPPHPLLAKGYRSIGCEPCTEKGEGREGRKLGAGGKKPNCPLNASDGGSQNWRQKVYLFQKSQGPDVGL